jgi:Ethanolamine utilization protein EutJ (predicted chaperonin)
VTTKEKINEELDKLETMLTSQQHITSPETVGAHLGVLSMYFHLMDDDDKDYLNCARIAMEEQIEWRF